MSQILFKDLEISRELKQSIADMGFEETTPVQEKSILPIIDGKDVLAQAPTGTGKTCAFGIPLIECTDPDSEIVSGLVLCPTRELCLQTNEELLKLSKYKKGIRVVPVYGGQDFSRQIHALKRRPQIIVATPGRLMDHMRRHTIKLENLNFMVLDEADEMLNMGFREDINTILKSVPEERQTMLFSATISPDIMKITKQYQKDAVLVQIERKEQTANQIMQYYVPVKSGNKFETLTRLMDIEAYKTCMVFCNTKRMVDRLTEQLSVAGYQADCIHGDMKQNQRDKVMGKFRKHTIDILVATDVAARGIDVEGIEAIFNYDLPVENEYYIHRIGRTGRANQSGVSYSFVQPKQMFQLKQIMRYAACTILPYKMPSNTQLKAARSDKLFAEINTCIADGAHKQYCASVSELLEKANGTFDATDLAAALLSRLEPNTMQSLPEAEHKQPQLSIKTAVRKDKEPVKINSDDEDCIRMFINVGSLDKINKRNMLDMFKIFTNLDVRRIAAIDIYDKYSFINIPAEEADNVVNSLSDASYKGRTVSIEIAQQTRKKPDKKSARFSRPHKRSFR